MFVSTDDVKAIRDAKAMSNEFEWVVVDSDRSQFKSDVKIEHRLTGIAGAKMDSHATMVSTLQVLIARSAGTAASRCRRHWWTHFLTSVSTLHATSFGAMQSC